MSKSPNIRVYVSGKVTPSGRVVVHTTASNGSSSVSSTKTSKPK